MHLHEFCRPFRTVPDVGGKTAVEFRFVANHQNAPFVFRQSAEKLVLCVLIEMVCGLVQKENVGRTVDQLAEAHFRLLAAAEDAYLTLDVLRGQSAFCQRGTDFKLRKRWEFFPYFLDACGGDALLCLLLKISDVQEISLFHGAGNRRDESQQAAEERRLSDAVGACQNDLLGPAPFRY